MKPYFLKEGVEALSNELSGAENIYLGIRPYGFHAGNATVFVVYPLLLCDALRKKRKVPRFTFYLFINDWEQDSLSGPNTKKYPFNIFPNKTTFQHMDDPYGCCSNIVDHWEPIIEFNSLKIKEKFPEVKIKCVRNSSMRENSRLKYYLFKTIKEPHIVLNAIRKYSNKKTLRRPVVYAMAICPNCHLGKGETEVINIDCIRHTCNACGFVKEGNYREFNFWFYHKVLALPRLDIFDIDLCITGLDHYNEGDFLIRKKLIEDFGNRIKIPKTLYAPTILGSDGKQMGKSKGNDVFVEIEYLLKIIKNNNNDRIKINLPQKNRFPIKKTVL
jgi:hypothetical protein